MARILWISAIILIGLTAAITLVSGIGTYCVAWNAEQYEEFANFVPYKPLYKAFVVLTIAVAIAAVVDLYGMIRRRKWAYLATPVVMLLLRILGIWQAINSEKPSDGSGAGTAAGLAMSVCGLAVIATPMWAGPTHTFSGYNWVNALLVPLTAGGVALILAGVGLLVFRNATSRGSSQVKTRPVELART